MQNILSVRRVDGKTDNVNIANAFKDKFWLSSNRNSCVNVSSAVSEEFLPWKLSVEDVDHFS